MIEKLIVRILFIIFEAMLLLFFHLGNKYEINKCTKYFNNEKLKVEENINKYIKGD